MRQTTLAFDVYGTLIDTQGIAAMLEGWIGERAPVLARAWREKQLEYTFRRGLMGAYADFDTCTEQALRYCCEALGIALDQDQEAELLQRYRQLPAFTDAAPALDRLRADGYRLFAFSNGTAETVSGLLRHAGLEDRFEGVVSVDEIGCFKPDPRVYRHFLQRANVLPADAWLISGNPFDVIGAQAAGMRTAWLDRSAQRLFDPWGGAPTTTIRGLGGLAAALSDSRGKDG
ncbi:MULTISPECIES: haloacid dehalogenase type II [unclassified Thioalkalivibrio]|uniref:haloacid dehalogenase type II n=1 Tax=unclassified Thioalkalivibrio TaxID=2621013 RepID=UPI00036717EF|nr:MULTISPECIES: haloacid dehalogenase type II [unclassified Thioalkalivibrio]